MVLHDALMKFVGVDDSVLSDLEIVLVEFAISILAAMIRTTRVERRSEMPSLAISDLERSGIGMDTSGGHTV